MSYSAKVYDKETGIRIIEVDTLLAIYNYMETEKKTTPYPPPPTIRKLMKLINVSSTSVVVNRLRLMKKSGLVVSVPSGNQGTTGLTTYGVEYAKMVLLKATPEEDDK